MLELNQESQQVKDEFFQTLSIKIIGANEKKEFLTNHNDGTNFQKKDENEEERKKKQKSREYFRDYYSKNKGELSEKRKKYRLTNRENINNQKREKYVKNREVICEKQREYWTKNKERVMERQKKYKLKNKEKISEKNRNNWIRKKKEKNENYVPRISWKNSTSMREFLDFAAKKLHISHYSDWYRISSKQIRQIGGKPFFSLFQKNLGFFLLSPSFFDFLLRLD